MSNHPQLFTALAQVLACPACLGSLRMDAVAAVCDACGAGFPHESEERLDLRLRRPRTVSVDFRIGAGLPDPSPIDWHALRLNEHAEVDFSGENIPNHLSKELLSHFPKARAAGQLVLDLGCGTSLHRGVCVRAGFTYVGLDYNNPGAPILGDAHALPFRHQSFDFVLSIAVLEHIQFPEVMLREVFRVLKPGGRFIGSASFLEPFHEISFQHHSHMGLLSVLQQAGFKVTHIAPGWDGATAITHMGLLAGAPSWVVKCSVAPLLALHRLWWLLLSRLRPGWDETTRRLKVGGAFLFFAERSCEAKDRLGS
jgi:SAM-dependent methyltransferase